MVWVRALIDVVFCLIGFAVGLAALQFLREAAREAQEDYQQHREDWPRGSR